MRPPRPRLSAALLLALAACAGHGARPAAAPSDRVPAAGPVRAPATPPPPVAKAPSPPPAPPPAPGTDGSGWPATFQGTAARLARDAAARADADVADHADLLAAIVALAGGASAETRIVRLPHLEAAERARLGRGTGWATLTTYVAPGADPDALRRAYVDFDRLHEWTGKTGTRTVGRQGRDVLGFTDAMRSALGMRYGARWAFRARLVERGPARLVVTRMEASPGTEGMLATRGILLLVPEAGGVRVAEATASVLDVEVPPLVRAFAQGAALRELGARTEGFRAHWKEYVRPP